MPTRYTTKQVQDMTGIPQPTIRRYVTDFPDFFTRDSKQGRIKYYSDKDVAIILFIRRAYESNFSAAQILDRLEAGNIEIKEGSALAMLPEVREAFRGIEQRQEAADSRIREIEQRTVDYFKDADQRVSAISGATRSHADDIRRQAAELDQLRQQRERDRRLFIRALLVILALAILAAWLLPQLTN